MTIRIIAQLKNDNRIVFDNVEHYYETRKTLEIVQEEMYKTKTSVIMKESLDGYTIEENRA